MPGGVVTFRLPLSLTLAATTQRPDSEAVTATTGVAGVCACALAVGPWFCSRALALAIASYTFFHFWLSAYPYTIGSRVCMSSSVRST